MRLQMSFFFCNFVARFLCACAHTYAYGRREIYGAEREEDR